jgi:hypothetical protein
MRRVWLSLAEAGAVGTSYPPVRWSDLFTHRRQLKHLNFDERIVSLLGKLPIFGCLVSKTYFS